jgi:hypothetical protein
VPVSVGSELTIEQNNLSPISDDSAKRVFTIDATYSVDALFENSDTQMWPGLVVKKSMGSHMCGVFVADNVSFATDQVVCDYKGWDRSASAHYTSFDFLTNVRLREQIEKYRFEYTRRIKARVIGAHEEDGSYGRLIRRSINHPNVWIKVEKFSSCDGSKRRLALFHALRKIEPGEELSWNPNS